MAYPKGFVGPQLPSLTVTKANPQSLIVPSGFVGPIAQPQNNLQFYRYDDNPEVWDSSGRHYSTPGELSSAGGNGKVQVLKRPLSPTQTLMQASSPIAQPIPKAPLPVVGANNTQPPKSLYNPPGMTFNVGAGLPNPNQVQNDLQNSTAYHTASLNKFREENQTANNMDAKKGLGDLLRAPVRAGLSVMAGAAGQTDPFFATTPAQQFIAGNDEITPLSRQAADLEIQFKDKGLGNAALPLAFAAVVGSNVLDLWPGLGAAEKKAAKEATALLTEQLGKGVAKDQALNIVYKQYGAKIGQAVEKGALPKIEEQITKKVTTQFNREKLGPPPIPPLKKPLITPQATPTEFKLPPVTKKDSIFTQLKNALKPIKGTDVDTQAAYRTFVNSKTAGKELAQTEAKALSNIPGKTGLLTSTEGKAGWQTILDYEKGKFTPHSEQIQQTFDNLRTEGIKRGLEIPNRANYLPQMYKNSPDEVVAAVAKYMNDKGVDSDIIHAYINGQELPETVSNALRLDPSFTKQRVFPDYETAMKYGLTPKYTHPSQLAAAWRESMEGSLANRQLISDLTMQGKLVGSKQGNMMVVDIPGLPKPVYAEPKLAKALNGLFRDEMNLSLGQTLAKGGAKASKFMQELALSAGFPGTDVNFFSIGQLIKEVTSGKLKAIPAFVRANFNGATIKFFEKKAPIIQKMADNGISMTDRAGNWRDMYKNMAASPEWSKMLGKGWDAAFQKKTFASFMPQLYVNTFEGAYKTALKKGLSDEAASKLAASVTRNFHGLTEDVARSKGTQDTLSTALFAPKFREGIINTLWNTGKSFTTQIRNPAFAKNRQLGIGMALTYGMYQALNQKLNGHYTWENETGREFALRIPLDDDQIMYVEFMPSFLSLPRNLIGGAIALAKLDTKTATQKGSSILSMPIQTASELLNNRNYFGGDIVGEYDSKEEKIKKWADYLLLQKTHPYIKLVSDLVDPFDKNKGKDEDLKKPLMQSLAEAAEFPVKFNSLARISRQEFYEAIEKKTKEDAIKKDRIQPILDQWYKLTDEGKDAEAEALIAEDKMSEDDYKIFKGLRSGDTRSDTITEESKMYTTKYLPIQELRKAGRDDEAQAQIDAMSDDEYHAYDLLRNRFSGL